MPSACLSVGTLFRGARPRSPAVRSALPRLAARVAIPPTPAPCARSLRTRCDTGAAVPAVVPAVAPAVAVAVAAVAVVALLGGAPAHATSSGDFTVAPVVVDGFDADETARLDRALQAAAAALPGHRPSPPGGAGVGCPVANVDCLVTLAVSRDVEQIIAPRARRAHDSGPGAHARSLELRLVEVRTAAVVARAVVPLTDNLDGASRAAFTAVFDGKARVGELVVETVPGAVVLVDGVQIGDGPVVRLAPAAPGPRSLLVRLPPAAPDADTDVDAAAAAPAEELRNTVDVLLGEPTTVKLVPSSAPLATAGAAAGSGANGNWPWLAAGGAVAGAVGVVGVVVGVAPYLRLTSAAAELANLEQRRLDGGRTLPEEVRAERIAYEENVAAWTTWGEALLIAGTAVAGAGAGVAAGAVLWGVLDE